MFNVCLMNDILNPVPNLLYMRVLGISIQPLNFLSNILSFSYQL